MKKKINKILSPSINVNINDNESNNISTKKYSIYDTYNKKRFKFRNKIKTKIK